MKKKRLNFNFCKIKAHTAILRTFSQILPTGIELCFGAYGYVVLYLLKRLKQKKTHTFCFKTFVIFMV